MIELPRKTALHFSMLLVGAFFIFIGVIAPPARIFFLVLGVPIVLVSAKGAFASSPRFRANTQGVWFGGGKMIPWSDVKAVYESNMDVRQGMLSTKTSAVAFDFHHRRTLFRTPVTHWFAAPFAVGDIDLAAPVNVRTPVFASQLEAMRVTVSELSR